MALFRFDLKQGTPDWYKARAGIPTASEFNSIITPKEMKPSGQRHAYACMLVAQRLLNYQPDSLDKIEHILDGKRREPAAVKQLEYVEDIVTTEVGFVTTEDGRFGASPDRILGSFPGLEEYRGSVDATLEVKGPIPLTHMQYLLSAEILRLDPKAKVIGGDDYRCQVQGQLFICEADTALFYSYHPNMPAFLQRSRRDGVFIRALRDCLERFSDELEALTEAAKRLGSYEKFADRIPTPVDAAYSDHIRSDPLTTEEELAAIIEQDMKANELHRAGA